MLSQPEARDRLNATLASNGIDNLLLFGGNGSLKFMLPLLLSWGIACIGIPTTIDNDVPGTSLSLGFDRTLANHFARTAYAGVKQNVLTGVTVVQNGQVSLRTETLAGLPDPVPDRNLYNLINGLG